MEVEHRYKDADLEVRVEVRYRNSSGERVLVIDTKAALAGLHLLPRGQSPPNQTDQAP